MHLTKDPITVSYAFSAWQNCSRSFMAFVCVRAIPTRKPNVMPRIWFGCSGCLAIDRDSM